MYEVPRYWVLILPCFKVHQTPSRVSARVFSFLVPPLYLTMLTVRLLDCPTASLKTRCCCSKKVCKAQPGSGRLLGFDGLIA